MKVRCGKFGCATALLLCLYLVFSLGSPSGHIEQPACGSAELELPAELRLQKQRLLPVPLSAVKAEGLREIDTVVVVPSEFNTDPETGIGLNRSQQELIEEIQGIIALSNEYLREANVRIKPVEYTFHSSGSDPYRIPALRKDAYGMLETATKEWQSYSILDYDMVLLLGRGSYNGTFGLAYPGVSCLSQRYSVVFATQGGSGAAREVALSHTIAHEVGHFLGMYHDNHVYSLGQSLMWPTFLNKPFGFSESSLSEAERHAGYGRPGGACLRVVPNEGDRDGDGLSDEGERRHGSNPDDRGSYIRSVRSPIYTAWNSFLGMVNILELVNPEDSPKTVSLELLSMEGKILHAWDFKINAKGQTDLILNDLVAFTPNAYGLLKISYAGELDGRMSYYRGDGITFQGYEFAFSIPLRNPQRGTSVVTFNTYQPSQAPERHGEMVANWLTLINLNTQPERFKVTSYDMSGAALKTLTVTIAPGGRRDIDGGHGFAGSSTVGLHQIVPINPQAPYLAELVRYGSSPDGYDFAFPLLAESGNGEVTVLPISISEARHNWVELANALHRPVTVQLEFLSSSGESLAQLDVLLKGFEQRHYDAATLLRTMGEESGSVVLSPSEANAVVAQSMFYYLDDRSDTVSAMYGSQMIEPQGSKLSGSYNLFLGVENLLTLINTASVPTSVKVLLQGVTGASKIDVALPANGSVRIPLYATDVTGLARDTYGLFTVMPELPQSVAAELLRIRTSGGRTELAIPTSVR